MPVINDRYLAYLKEEVEHSGHGRHEVWKHAAFASSVLNDED